MRTFRVVILLVAICVLSPAWASATTYIPNAFAVSGACEVRAE